MARWPSRITDPNSPSASLIMNDGAGLVDVLPEITVLILMTGIFLGLGASLFSWDR